MNESTMSSRKRWSKALAVCLGVAAASLVAGAAAWTNAADRETTVIVGQPGGPITVSPTQGSTGTVVTVSGTGCTGSSPLAIVTLRGEAEPSTNIGTSAHPDASGSWSTSGPIRANVAAGNYEIEAVCYATSTGDVPFGDHFDYAGQPFQVLPGERAMMTVSPLAIPVGSSGSLTVSGTVCRNASRVIVTVESISHQFPDSFVENAHGEVVPNAQGDWSMVLAVPTGTPERFLVQGSCQSGLAMFFNYQAANVTVYAVSFTG